VHVEVFDFGHRVLLPNAQLACGSATRNRDSPRKQGVDDGFPVAGTRNVHTATIHI